MWMRRVRHRHKIHIFTYECAASDIDTKSHIYTYECTTFDAKSHAYIYKCAVSIDTKSHIYAYQRIVSDIDIRHVKWGDLTDRGANLKKKEHVQWEREEKGETWKQREQKEEGEEEEGKRAIALK